MADPQVLHLILSDAACAWLRAGKPLMVKRSMEPKVGDLCTVRRTTGAAWSVVKIVEIHPSDTHCSCLMEAARIEDLPLLERGNLGAYIEIV